LITNKPKESQVELINVELKMPSADQLLKETAEGIAVMEMAADTFRTGKPSLSGLEERANYYMDPATNKMFQLFDKGRLYAFEGRPCSISADDIYHAFAFVMSAWTPADYFGCVIPYGCNATLQVMYARDKLNRDKSGRVQVIHGKGHVIDYYERLPYGYEGVLTIPELAALSGLAQQSVRNALHADKSIKREVGSQSRQIEVPAAVAREWLKGKGRFREYEPPKSSKQISVPEAKDGTFFSASCKRSKGYTVGKKGEERPFKTFAEALAELDKMPVPYWRRPSKTTGVHGIVKGRSWVSKSRKELGLK
jgi:hypothetical protein